MAGSSRRAKQKIFRIISGLILIVALVFAWVRTGSEVEDLPEGVASIEEYWSTVEEDALVAARRCTVHVESGNLMGSGVLLEGDSGSLILVTAAHVIDDQTDVVVTFDDGSRATANRLWLDPDFDLAFFTVTGKQIPKSFPKEITAAAMDAGAYDSLIGNEYVFLRDWEFTNELGYTFSTVKDPFQYIEDFGQYMLVLTGTAREGMSGAGAFTSEGQLLGILVGANEEELVCIPLNVLETRLEVFTKSLE